MRKVYVGIMPILGPVMIAGLRLVRSPERSRQPVMDSCFAEGVGLNG